MDARSHTQQVHGSLKSNCPPETYRPKPGRASLPEGEPRA
jgi:hypothetical protein